MARYIIEGGHEQVGNHWSKGLVRYQDHWYRRNVSELFALFLVVVLIGVDCDALKNTVSWCVDGVASVVVWYTAVSSIGAGTSSTDQFQDMPFVDMSCMYYLRCYAGTFNPMTQSINETPTFLYNDSEFMI